MFNLCVKHPYVSSLGLSWNDALELPVKHCITLLEKLDYLQSRQARTY